MAHRDAEFNRAARARGNVRFVLNRPQTGGNAGAAARVLANLGFERLVLVAPEFRSDNDEARRMAVAAYGLLDTAPVHGDLDRALAGASVVVGTTARTGKHRKPHRRLDEIAPEIAARAADAEVAIVFGREDSGLEDAELDRCTHLVYLPSTSTHPSFNLAQAVAITAYELARSGWPAPPHALDAPAAHEDREAMFAHLETALCTIGFLAADSVEPIMRRLRRLVGRAEPTETEVRLLRGVARQALWAAGRAGLPRLDRAALAARRGGERGDSRGESGGG